MDAIWLSIAFICGLAAHFLRLPVLVGYLAAGFILGSMGAESGDFIEITKEIGLMLLLFTIGLKLKVKTLLRPAIWAGTSIQMLLCTMVFGIFIFLLGYAGMHHFAGLDLITSFIIAFALSFSSTVYAVKVLEEKGDMSSYHGRLAIGILIMQDIFAVVFLVFAAGNIPHWWALLLLPGLFLIQWFLKKIFSIVGHGELLILFGMFAALVSGAYLFDFSGLKPDLGALIMGVLLSGHQKANELYDKLISFKDIFLIGFFLSIGLLGIPDFNMAVAAIAIALFINVKLLIYFFIFNRFQYRSRTAFHATLTLANYSEFGLIVAASAYGLGWMTAEWIIIIALALSISFLVSSPLINNANSLYARAYKYLRRLETVRRLPDDVSVDIGDAEILIFGMGRIGTAAYDQLQKNFGQKVLAIDYSYEKVTKHMSEGRNVVHDDATDAEFWINTYANHLHHNQVKLIILCLNEHQSNMYAVKQLKSVKYNGKIAATALYDDQVDELRKWGVDLAFNQASEAGFGLANQVCDSFCNIVTNNLSSPKKS